MGRYIEKLRDQSTDELNAMLKDLRKDRFKLVNELRSMRKLEKPHRLNEKRKEIARVMTLLTEKEKGRKSHG